MKKPLTVTIPHRLSKQEALRRIQEGLGRAKPQLAAYMSSIEDQWVGDRMEFRVTALGQAVTGRVHVDDDNANIEVDLPWLLHRLAEKVRGQIQQRGVKMLEKK